MNRGPSDPQAGEARFAPSVRVDENFQPPPQEEKASDDAPVLVNSDRDLTGERADDGLR